MTYEFCFRNLKLDFYFHYIKFFFAYAWDKQENKRK